MEKYRTWTDEHAGVNPFVAAHTQTTNLPVRLLSFIVGIIKTIIFILYIPFFVILYSLPLPFLQQTTAGLLLLLFGVYSQEDYALTKITKQTSPKIVLSNHTCFIDVLYLLYKFPGCYFIGFSQNQQKSPLYYSVSPLQAFFSLFSSLQPFYSINSKKGFSTLKDLFESEKTLQFRCVIFFYEKIRTIGRGTIRIQKSLTQDLFNLQKDLVILQMKYSAKREDLFSLTSSASQVLFTGLSTTLTGNNIKVRALKQASQSTHSPSQLRQAVCSMSLGALLQTDPNSYFQFYNFYKKTQQETYKSQ